ncbi:MAG: gfo/Idh/MocA family oxidoreductase, partial [Planctomycetota bacterium]
IGKVTRVEVGLPGRTNKSQNIAPSEPPEWLDWNLWLGPAPWRPFVEFGARTPHWDWRWIMDFSGGQLTDWAGHYIDIAHWGLGLEHTGPVEIEGEAEYPTDGVFDTPGVYNFDCTYADGMLMNVSSRNPGGVKWIGDEGWIWVSRKLIRASAPKILKERIGPEEIRLYASGSHRHNFVDCVRTRRQTVAPAEAAHRSISVGLLGEIAMLTGRTIKWDPKSEEIIGDPQASSLLGRSYREPWAL